MYGIVTLGVYSCIFAMLYYTTSSPDRVTRDDTWAPMVVSTDSGEPVIHKYSLVKLEHIKEFDDLEIGDYVGYTDSTNTVLSVGILSDIEGGKLSIRSMDDRNTYKVSIDYVVGKVVDHNNEFSGLFKHLIKDGKFDGVVFSFSFGFFVVLGLGAIVFWICFLINLAVNKRRYHILYKKMEAARKKRKTEVKAKKIEEERKKLLDSKEQKNEA